MTNILGYDIDGRPLRAGDYVLVLRVRDSTYQDYVGKPVEILGPGSARGKLHINVQPRNRGDAVQIRSEQVRKLGNDHKPASESFQDIMRKYGSKQGVSA